MLAFSYLLTLPLVAATFWPQKPEKPPVYCGTVTATCTSVTRVPSELPSTSTCVVWGKCYTTTTRTQVNCKTEWATKTNTVTRTPIVWVTATPSKTVTRTNWHTQCTKKWKKDDIPDDMTNQERMQRGLPPRALQDRTFWWPHKPPPPGPSCVPTTTTKTEWITKTTPHVVTSTSTKCLYTRTSIVPSWSTYTRTKTDCVTTNGPPITKTNPCPTYATTTVQATTTKWCW